MGKKADTLSPTANAKSIAVGKDMRRFVMEFQEADLDENGQLDFSEWVGMLPEPTRQTRTEKELRVWFDLIDRNGNGAVRTPRI